MLSRSSSEELVLDIYSLPSSPEIGERTPVSTDEEMEETSTSLFFDNETSARASVLHDQMRELIDISIVKHGTAIPKSPESQKYFADLNRLRKSAYYRALKSELELGEKLTAGEYAYFALTTDNVNQLNPQALREITNFYSIYSNECFKANIEVLIAALELSQIKRGPEFSQCNIRLKKALMHRASLQESDIMYLNLHGIKLHAVDLSLSSLDYTDLGGADLSVSILHDTSFQFSNLDHANLKNTNCIRPNSREILIKRGPSIKYSSARNAIFDGMEAPNIYWQYSDFTGSSFKNTTMGPGCYTDAIFDKTNFTDGTLIFSRTHKTVTCSLKGANFANGNIIDANFSNLDLTKTELLPEYALNSNINFSIALDVINAKFLDPIRYGNDQGEYLISELTTRKNIIANAVIQRLGESGLSRKQKIECLDIALDHAVFVPENLLQRLANSTDRGILSLGNTLFGDQQRYHACYATPAMTMLDHAREQILQNENKLRA